jgi:putative transposase
LRKHVTQSRIVGPPVELLDVEVFHNLADAQVKLSLFRRFYNEQRPYSSLGYMTPAQAVLSCRQGYS